MTLLLPLHLRNEIKLAEKASSPINPSCRTLASDSAVVDPVSSLQVICTVLRTSFHWPQNLDPEFFQSVSPNAA